MCGLVNEAGQRLGLSAGCQESPVLLIEASDGGRRRIHNVGVPTGRFRMVNMPRPPESRLDATPHPPDRAQKV